MIDALIHIYDKNLDYAQRLVEDLTDEQCVLQPAAEMNHPAWVLGHLAHTSDKVLVGMLLGGASTFPEAYAEKLNAVSVPTSDISLYPDKQTNCQLLADAHERAKALLETFDPARLSEPPAHEGFAKRFDTLAKAFAWVMIGHENVHLGQLSAWRRVQGLPRV